MTATVVPLHKRFEVPEFTDIRSCWDTIKPGIEFVLRENPHLTYMPEDVFSECSNGKSMLFTSSLGFVVLTVQEDPFSKEKVLVVWIAYTHEHGKHNWLDHIDWFEGVAKYCGCRTIEAQSAVSNLGTYLSKSGWEQEATIYTREVKPDGK